VLSRVCLLAPSVAFLLLPLVADRPILHCLSYALLAQSEVRVTSLVCLLPIGDFCCGSVGDYRFAPIEGCHHRPGEGCCDCLSDPCHLAPAISIVMGRGCYPSVEFCHFVWGILVKGCGYCCRSARSSALSGDCSIRVCLP